MKYIICLETKPWGPTPHRTQQLMIRLTKRSDVTVLYFYPKMNKKSKIVHKKKVAQRVFAYSLPRPIIASVSEHFASFYEKRLANYITRVCRAHRVRRPLIWTTHPSQVFLMDQLSYKSLIYDCASPCAEGWEEHEEELLMLCDLAVAGSKLLQKKFSRTNKNTIILENGVDYEFFSQSKLVPSHKNIRLGFVGVITENLDLSHALFAAKTQPQWRFMFVGPCSEQNPFVPQLRSLFNVTFLGQRPASVLPDFMSACHVLLDFRYLYLPKSDVVPIHILEYLSTGRPILSTLWEDEILRFPDVVYWAETETEFVKLCKKAMMESPLWVSDRRKNYGKQADWSVRIATLDETLETTDLL